MSDAVERLLGVSGAIESRCKNVALSDLVWFAMGEGGGRKGTARGIVSKDVAWRPVDLFPEVPEALLDCGVVGFLEEEEAGGGSNKPLERVDIVRLEGEAAGGDSIEVLECEPRVDPL